MTVEIEKAGEIGFCFGVRRAIDILEKVARERGSVETLGALVHNRQVLQRLAGIGVKVASGIDDIHGNIVVTGAHGIAPRVEKELKARQLTIVNTTCPFVLRAQKVAQRLARSGFLVIIYGDANHPEVKGILGWANDVGLATLDAASLASFETLPRRLGVLAQTTQIADHFTEFTKELLGLVLTKDSEIRVIDTICHDIRRRQAAAMDLASKVDLMLVTGDHTSANTNRLAELCSGTTTTRLIETADEIKPAWVQKYRRIGITGGASTAEQTISEVLARLEVYTGKS
jgi:4-hydroxy-3-methylbut-2-enyl diphosphate reductase